MNANPTDAQRKAAIKFASEIYRKSGILVGILATRQAGHEVADIGYEIHDLAERMSVEATSAFGPFEEEDE